MPDAVANEYEAARREKRDALREAGHRVYGQRTEGIQPIEGVRAQHTPETGPEGGPTVTVAGRVVLKRDMGKLSFLTIRDHTGDLQLGLQKNRLDDAGWAVRDALDLGDLIVASGPLGTTKTGEPTVWAESVSMSAKSLVVPPEKHKGLEDQELRYRQRYVDLWANPESMEVMKKRFAIIDAMRRYLRERGFVEVETPMLQPIHGGAAARPFETHHNAYDIPLFLRIAPELYLKRLLVGGMTKVFEINRNFRNEGVSPRHNPEFTMLEAYEAYGNWETMAELVEDMICTVAMEVLGTTEVVIHHGGHGGTEGQKIDLGKRPWRRVSMAELVEHYTGWRFEKRSLDEGDLNRIVYSMLLTRNLLPNLWEYAPGNADSDEHDDFLSRLDDMEDMNDFLAMAKEAMIELKTNVANALQEMDDCIGDDGDVADEDDLDEAKEHVKCCRARQNELRDAVAEAEEEATLAYVELVHLKGESAASQLVWMFEKFVESKLIEPTFVTSVPSVVIPLARPREDDPYFADVYELAIGGQEISPGYTELNDPDVQARLFRDQAVEDEGERQKVDYDFLHALKVGMPPAGGMGLGVDRLVMLLLGQPSIRDVLAFPLMKPGSDGRHEGTKARRHEGAETGGDA